MRFSIDVLPRQPLTWAQPVRPALHLVAQHVLRDPLLELIDEVRPLGPRADQRHVAAQHVPELRHLVDVGPAQEPPDRRARAGRLRCAQTGPVSASASHTSNGTCTIMNALPSRPIRSCR